jgi:uncharacterized protein YndB with AHSA1/START domain
MSPNPQARPELEVLIDRAANTIVMTRKLAAPRMRVFEAWTQPQHVACWWDPSGSRLTLCEIDLRPGGAFRFVPEGSPDVPTFSGTYLEIAPPERLVFGAMGSVGSVALEDLAGTTQMTVTITCASAAHLDHFLHMGVDAGTAQTLDNLVAYVRSYVADGASSV